MEVDFSDSDEDGSVRGGSVEDSDMVSTAASLDTFELLKLRIKPGTDPKVDLEYISDHLSDPLKPAFVPAKFEAIATKLQQWFPDELRKHGIPTTNVSGYIRDWYARCCSSGMFAGAIKDRKKKLEVTLDVELVPIQIDAGELPIFRSAVEPDEVVLAGYAIVAFAPEGYSTSSASDAAADGNEEGTDANGEGESRSLNLRS